MCEQYKQADKKDLEMMKACQMCDVSWEKCPGTSDCPRLLDLLRHVPMECPDLEEDPSGDPINNGDPVNE